MKLPFVRTVNAHGLVTIPAKMRHELGWKPGTKLVIAVVESRFVLQSAKDRKKEQRQAKPAKTKRKSRESSRGSYLYIGGSKGVSPEPSQVQQNRQPVSAACAVSRPVGWETLE